jgi:hypothetical protein
VFCSFVALLLRVELEERLAHRDWKLEWADIVDDLDRRQEIEINVGGKAYTLRTEAKGAVGKVFQACGVALPPTVRSAQRSGSATPFVSLRPRSAYKWLK